VHSALPRRRAARGDGNAGPGGTIQASTLKSAASGTAIVLLTAKLPGRHLLFPTCAMPRRPRANTVQANRAAGCTVSDTHIADAGTTSTSS
jgi:hypothetical protein